MSACRIMSFNKPKMNQLQEGVCYVLTRNVLTKLSLTLPFINQKNLTIFVQPTQKFCIHFVYKNCTNCIQLVYTKAHCSSLAVPCYTLIKKHSYKIHPDLTICKAKKNLNRFVLI